MAYSQGYRLQYNVSQYEKNYLLQYKNIFIVISSALRVHVLLNVPLMLKGWFARH